MSTTNLHLIRELVAEYHTAENVDVRASIASALVLDLPNLVAEIEDLRSQLSSITTLVLGR
jgi:hypothetical protein